MKCFKVIIVVLTLSLPFLGIAQHEDCDIADVICSDGQVSFNSQGSGINDFLYSGNHEGCLETLENQSSWYYFEFTIDMPPNSSIEFTIDPNGGFTEDYDFAIFGPDVPCNGLGDPVRCSFANFLCDLCPLTGLGMGATDTSEGAPNEDGFVAPLTVQPGEGYYLMLDNWYGSSDGFTLTWGGSAAAYLNCNANPACNNLAVNAGTDLPVCAGDSLTLSASISNASPGATVSWTDTTGVYLYLSDTTALQPTFYPPLDLSGPITLMVTVVDGECQKTDAVTINVTAAPEVEITGDSLLCPNTTVNLQSNDNYVSYQWSTNANTETIDIDSAGIYWLSVENMDGCSSSDTLEVIAVSEPTPTIQGSTQICDGDSTQLSLEGPYEAFIWNDMTIDSSLTAFDAGDYSVMVTDSNGCMAEAFFTLSVAALPQPEIQGANAICEGDSTILNTINSYEAYQWSGGATEAAISVQAQGNYGVTVTDTNGCIGETDFFLTVNDNPIPNMLVGPPFCPGDSTRIEVNMGLATYLWPNGETDNVLYALEGGSYTVTVTNMEGCEGTGTVEAIMYDTPEPEIVGDSAFCAGDSLSLSVNMVFAEYLWSDGSSNSTFNTSNGGNVTLTVTDDNGCEGTTDFNVEELALPVFSIIGAPEYCEGENTVLEVAESFVEYDWSNGEATAAITIDQPGMVAVEVTNADGCISSESIMVVENALPAVNITGEFEICEDVSSILDAGVGFATYEWSDNSGGQTLEVNATGSYSVMVIDANGCSNQDEVEVIVHTLPEPVISGDLSFCVGETTILEGGIGYVTYEWSNNTNNQIVEVSSPGMVTLTVTDVNGCQGITSQEVVENALPVPEIQGEDGFCPGEAVSLATLQNWEAYQWSTGQNTSTINVNLAGDFNVTVTDANGCMGSTNQFVAAYSAPTPQIIGELQFCPGTSTTLSTSEAYVAYDWGIASSADLTVDMPGNYSLTVTDINGCEGVTTEAVNLYEVNPPEISAELGFCSGESVIVEAGVNYQSYQWSDNSTEPFLSIAVPGDYDVTVIDENNCTSSTAFSVEEYALPQPAIQAVPGLCPDATTTLAAVGTFSTYLWSDGTENPNLLIDTPGLYELFVTNENGCEGSSSVDILAYQNPEPEIVGNSEICPEEITTLSLTQNYDSYQWTGDITMSMVTVAEPGIIQVEVTNATGCTGQTSIEITGLPAPDFSINGDTAFCVGGSTLLTVPAQYANYEWSPSGAFPELQVTQAGMYAVTITNVEGCTASQSVMVSEIALPVVEAGVNQVLDCSIQSVSIGDEMPLPEDRYTYNWTGPDINADNQNLPFLDVEIAGTYELLVEDEWYGCQSEMVIIEVEDLSYEPEINFAEVETLNCAELTTLIDGSLSDSHTGIQYHWLGESGPILTTDEAFLTVEEGGWYYLNLEDTITGCAAIDSIFVEEDRILPEIAIAMPEIINCYDSIVVLDAENSSNGSEFVYQWSSEGGNIEEGEFTLAPQVNAMGWYVLTIQNQINACIVVDSVFVDEDSAPPLVDAGDDANLDCVVRALQLDPANFPTGVAYQLSWTDESGNPLPESTIPNPTVDQPGIYQLMVTNLNNGCSGVDVVQINDMAEYPVFTEVEVLDPSCFGDENGQILVNGVENGMPPYAYTVDGEFFTFEGVFQNLAPGNYDLTVEDAAGCASTFPLSINEATPISVDLGGDRQINLGEILTLEPIFAQSGIGLVEYDWRSVIGDSCLNCTELVLRPFETGEVQVIATDENGCQTSDIITVFVARKDEVFIPNAFSPNDDGVNDIFMVYAGEDVHEISSIMVVDRWGGKVYEDVSLAPNDISRGWDGSTRGQQMAPAVYVYVIEVEFIDGRTKIFKGDISLIR